MPKYRVPKYIPKEDYNTALHYAKRYPVWKEELNTAPDTSRAIRYDTDKVQTSPEDVLAETAAAVLDLDREIEQLRRQKARLIRGVVKTIETLEDDREKLILTAYFVSRMTIRQVADEVHYSPTQTYRIYRAGLLHLAERWNTWNSGAGYTVIVT